MRMVVTPVRVSPLSDGPLNRRRAAVLRQQRSVHVDDAERRQVDDGLRNDLAVAHHHHGLGAERAQVLDRFRPAHALRLVDRQAQPQRRLPSRAAARRAGRGRGAGRAA